MELFGSRRWRLHWPKQKAVVLMLTQKIMQHMDAIHYSIVAWLLGWSSCSASSAKELHELGDSPVSTAQITGRSFIELFPSDFFGHFPSLSFFLCLCLLLVSFIISPLFLFVQKVQRISTHFFSSFYCVTFPTIFLHSMMLLLDGARASFEWTKICILTTRLLKS